MKSRKPSNVGMAGAKPAERAPEPRPTRPGHLDVTDLMGKEPESRFKFIMAEAYAAKDIDI